MYLIYFGLISVYRFMTGGNIVVTPVDEKHNEYFRHPLYTICPVLQQNANVSDKSATLLSVMLENGLAIAPVNYHSLLNDPSNEPEAYTTWTPGLANNGSRHLVMMQCQTFDFAKNVTPGNFDGKVKLVLTSNDPHIILKNNRTPIVDEFRVFIHQAEGYLGFLMHLDGKAHITIPGFSEARKRQMPQMFHYVIRYIQAIITSDGVELELELELGSISEGLDKVHGYSNPARNKFSKARKNRRSTSTLNSNSTSFRRQ